MSTAGKVLRSLGLGHHVAEFEAQGIDDEQDLLLLTEAQLTELGVKKVGERNRLLRYIRDATKADVSVAMAPRTAGAPLTLRETDNAMAVFNEIDADGGGTLDVDELTDALKRMDLYVSDAHARALFRDMDADGNGSINAEEFLAVVRRSKNDPSRRSAFHTAIATDPVTALSKLSSPSTGLDAVMATSAKERQHYRAVFDAIDDDGNDALDRGEFADALRRLGIEVSDKEAERLFREADRDGGGSIDFVEFVNLVQRAKRGDVGLADLRQLASGSDDVLKKLQASTSISVSGEDILNAEITPRAKADVEKYLDDGRWRHLPGIAECPEGGCTRQFNLLVLSADMLRGFVHVVCEIMMDDLSSKMAGIGVMNFQDAVNMPGVVSDAMRIVLILLHRYSCGNPMGADVPTGAALEHIHSVRKTAVVIASHKSMEDVYALALRILEHIRDADSASDRDGYRRSNSAPETRDLEKDLRMGASAFGILANAPAAVEGAVVVSGIAAAACTVM